MHHRHRHHEINVPVTLLRTRLCKNTPYFLCVFFFRETTVSSKYARVYSYMYLKLNWLLGLWSATPISLNLAQDTLLGDRNWKLFKRRDKQNPMHMGDTGETNDISTVTFKLFFFWTKLKVLVKVWLKLVYCWKWLSSMGHLLLFLYLTNISYKKPANPFAFNSRECFLNMLTVTDWSGRQYNALLTIFFFEQNTPQRYSNQPMIYIIF